MRATMGLLLMLLICAGSSSAQTVSPSIEGIVTDSNGAAIVSAKVTARNIYTDASREIETDGAGRYLIPLLPPGEYEVLISAHGFKKELRQRIKLAVGQELVIDVTLSPGDIASQVNVLAEATTVNTTSAAMSGLVNDKQIRDLPLNGRSFQQLALLQTGVTPALAAGSDVVGGRTPKISVNGARPEQNNFLLDGTDINNVYNKTPGSVGGVLLGVDAVLEFQVLTNAYSAEFGRSAGGQINAVTRSGENTVHGSAFEFLRNSALDARDFFDPAARPIPPFKRNQFGGVLGGPIHKDRTFFFGAFESLIDRLGVTGVTSVPTLAARQGSLPSGQ